MKRRGVILAAVIVCLSVLWTGSTLSRKEVGTKTKAVSLITTEQLAVGIGEDRSGQAELFLNKIMPGAKIEKSCFVENQAEYDMYVRVMIQKSLGQQSSKGFQKSYDLDTEAIHMEGTSEGWIKGYEDDEQEILYYQYPLEAGQQSTDFLNGISLDSKMQNQYTNQAMQLEIQAQAVQVFAAESAIPSAWGVYPSIDENGMIQSISE